MITAPDDDEALTPARKETRTSSRRCGSGCPGTWTPSRNTAAIRGCSCSRSPIEYHCEQDGTTALVAMDADDQRLYAPTMVCCSTSTLADDRFAFAGSRDISGRPAAPRRQTKPVREASNSQRGLSSFGRDRVLSRASDFTRSPRPLPGTEFPQPHFSRIGLVRPRGRRIAVPAARVSAPEIPRPNEKAAGHERPPLPLNVEIRGQESDEKHFTGKWRFFQK